MTGRIRSVVAAPTLVCLAGWLSAACGGSDANPMTPSQAVVDGRTISGAVTDVIQGAAMPGVTVAIEQAGSAATDASGQFAFASAVPNGRYRTTLSGPSVITRQTTAPIGTGALSYSLIPSTFDMTAFDQFARSFGNGAIIGWSIRPALIVDTSVVATPDPLNAATASQVAASEADRVITELSQALPTLTGSAFTTFAAVITRTTPAGDTIRMYTPGAITVVYYTANDGACGRGGPATLPPYEIAAGAIWLKLGCASAAANTYVLIHELGHALGYGHVIGTTSIMSPTGNPSGISDFDRAAALIVARRSAGSRSPDTDPEFLPATSAATRSISGRQVILPPLP